MVYEVRRDRGEVGHAQHGAVDAHAVPCHPRVARRHPAETDGRQRGAPVALDEHRRVEREDVGHRQGDVLFQREGVERGLLHTDVLHRPLGGDFDLAELALSLVLGMSGRSGHEQPRKQGFVCGVFLSHESVPFHFQQNAPGMIPT